MSNNPNIDGDKEYQEWEYDLSRAAENALACRPDHIDFESLIHEMKTQHEAHQEFLDRTRISNRRAKYPTRAEA